jgi:hypothetical protein
VDRWHKETSNFHIPSGEITVTLDDVYCLLHLPIEGTLFDHHDIIDKVKTINLMVAYLGASPAAADHQITVTRGAHARFTYLRTLMCSHLQHLRQFQMAGDIVSMLMYRDWSVRTYLLFVVGTTVFSNNSKNYIDLTYLRSLSWHYKK